MDRNLNRAIRQKVECPECVDRISDLPDSLVIHILSFLPTIYAVMTSLLSTRWRRLWKEVPVVDMELRNPIADVLDFIEKTIKLHRASGLKITKFQLTGNSISGKDRQKLAGKLDSVFRSFMVLHTEYLSLSFLPWGGIPSVVYIVSDELYLCGTLKELKLKGCGLVWPIGRVEWKSLRVLDVGDVTWSNDMVAGVLAGCPVLESLALRRFRGITHMNLTSLANLTELVLEDCSEFSTGPRHKAKKLCIWAPPHLWELEFSGDWYYHWPNLIDARSLVKAHLNLWVTYPDRDWDIHAGWKLLQMVRESEQLKVGPWFLQVLTPIDQNMFCDPLSRLKWLDVDMNFCYRNQLRGICDLLQNSPTLERLVVHIFHKFNKPDQEDSVPGSFQSDVKIVSLHGFEASSKGFRLAEILLRSMKILEKIDIYPDQSVGKRSLLNLAKALLKLPRSSPDAVVMFH